MIKVTSLFLYFISFLCFSSICDQYLQKSNHELIFNETLKQDNFLAELSKQYLVETSPHKKGAIKRKAKKIIETYLNNQNIAYELINDPDEGMLYAILPIADNNYSKLNRFAHTMYEKHNQLEIFLSLDYALTNSLRGAYTQSNNAILLAKLIQLNLKPIFDDTLTHELIHAKLASKQRDGELSFLQTSIAPKNQGDVVFARSHYAYNNFLGFDEIMTFFLDMQKSRRRYFRHKENGKLQLSEHMLEEFESNLGYIDDVVEMAIKSVQTVRRNLQNQTYKNISLDYDEFVEISGAKNLFARVHFFINKREIFFDAPIIGKNSERLSKIFSSPGDDDLRTLTVTPKSTRPDELEIKALVEEELNDFLATLDDMLQEVQEALDDIYLIWYHQDFKSLSDKKKKDILESLDQIIMKLYKNTHEKLTHSPPTNP